MSQRFFLGREADAGGALGARLELDPADLLTHGFLVGMTGSGKTGLGIVLIEEALRQGVPVLAIDPKGDLANLLLLFDDLAPASFAPWVDPEAARRAGQTAEQAAAATAAAWSRGLAEWGLGAAEVAALRRSHDAVVYTPGSASGVGLGVLRSLDAPAVPFASAEEDLRDEIAGFVSGLLGLVRIEADPLKSREFILLATLIESAWRDGRSLSLEGLIASLADPPLETLGALPLETVYPRKERVELLLALNNLLASPAFESWREGEPLEVERLLHAPDGRPRLAVVYTAHLSDEERLFATALLLDKVKTWMRRQRGTSGLRALVYMDEVYGYLPPHPANPATKRPLLTLLKQARGQGVGIVLATQNPVDLDYKGLANIGTWMVGKLQTEQDRARLREGLLDAGLGAGELDRLLDGARQRVFLLHDVHRPAACLLHSRWALSYLRGPLTRDEVSRLMAGRGSGEPARPGRVAPAAAPPPLLPAPLRHQYLRQHGGELADAHLFVKYAVRYRGGGEVVGARAYPLSAASAAEVLDAEPIELAEGELASEAPPGLRYGELPAWLPSAGARGLEKALRERLPDKLAVFLLLDPATKTTSAPGETPDAFAARLQAGGAGPQAEKLREKLEKKRRELAAREQELAGRRTEKWAAVGTALLSNLGLFTGRKRTITGAASVLAKNRMENSVESRIEALRAEIGDLQADLARLEAVEPGRFETTPVVPGRGDVKILRYDLVWVY